MFSTVSLSLSKTLQCCFSISSVLFDIDILLTRGIGNGAIQKLAKHSVACYKIEETDPDMAITKLDTILKTV